jgi:hypothetical protein
LPRRISVCEGRLAVGAGMERLIWLVSSPWRQLFGAKMKTGRLAA